jgi:hypothetical protein
MAKRDAIFPAGRHDLYTSQTYSAAIRSGDLLFVSGHVGSRSDGSPERDFESQVRLAFAKPSPFTSDKFSMPLKLSLIPFESHSRKLAASPSRGGLRRFRHRVNPGDEEAHPRGAASQSPGRSAEG